MKDVRRSADAARMRGAPLAIALFALSPPAAASEVGCPGRIEEPAATATFYETLVPNACGLPVAPGAFVAAVAEVDFAGSAACGRCARVTGPLGSVVAQITDYCPEVGNPLCVPGHLDLGRDAFEQIANPQLGLVDVSWETVACEDAGTIAFLFRSGSNPYYAKVQVRHHRYGIAKLELRVDDAWVDLPRTSDGHFERFSPAPLPGALDFRITDVHGGSVEAPAIPYVVEAEQDAGVQLATCPEPIGAGGAALLGLLAVASRRARRKASP